MDKLKSIWKIVKRYEVELEELEEQFASEFNHLGESWFSLFENHTKLMEITQNTTMSHITEMKKKLGVMISTNTDLLEVSVCKKIQIYKIPFFMIHPFS